MMIFGVAMKKQAGITYTRADIDTSTINSDAKTFEVVFATENPVFRSYWWADEAFYEVLVCDKKSIRSERLDAGVVPLLDTHNSTSVTDQYGIVRSWSIKNGECRAVIEWSSQPSKAELWSDIEKKVIRSISVGPRIWKYERVPNTNLKEVPTYRAVDWEPVEISLATVPVDYKSATRADAKDEHEIEILNYKQNRADMTPEEILAQQNRAIADEHKRGMDIRLAVRAANLPEAFADELIVRADNGKPLAMDAVRAAITAQQAIPAPLTQDDINRALETEQKRSTEIRTAVRAAALPETFADELIGRKVENRTLTVDQAKAAVLDKMAEKDINIGGPGSGGGARAHGDERTHIISAMTEGMMHRAVPGSVQKFYAMSEETKTRAMDVKAHDYKHMNFIDIARSILTMNGVPNVMSMSPAEVAKRALDTTDLPDLFTSTVKRFLLMNYQPVVPEWMRFSKAVPASDFRIKTGVKFDAAVTFEELGEDGEYKEANLMSNEKATIQLKTYARSFGISRKTIINDDLGVLTDIPTAIGLGAKQFQSKKVWGMITTNNGANTPDGKSLFHADHGNFATGANASQIEDTSLSAGRTAMNRQLSPQKNELDINPAFLLVPPELRTKAQKLLRLISPIRTEDVNIWGDLEPVSNVYLKDPLAWYMVAAPGSTTAEGMVHSYLSGQEGLYTESYIDQKTDKLVIKSRLDFDCQMWGYAGWYKNSGAAQSTD